MASVAIFLASVSGYLAFISSRHSGKGLQPHNYVWVASGKVMSWKVERYEMDLWTLNCSIFYTLRQPLSDSGATLA